MDLPDGEKKSEDMCTRFDRMYECDRHRHTHTHTHRHTHTHTDRHRMTAKAALDASIARQKLKRNIDELKHCHLGLYYSGHHRQYHWPVANTAACMCKGKGTSLRTPTVVALFRATYTPNWFFSEPLTLQWEEDNINFRFLCNVRWCRNITKVRTVRW